MWVWVQLQWPSHSYIQNQVKNDQEVWSQILTKLGKLLGKWLDFRKIAEFWLLSKKSCWWRYHKLKIWIFLAIFQKAICFCTETCPISFIEMPWFWYPSSLNFFWFFCRGSLKRSKYAKNHYFRNLEIWIWSGMTSFYRKFQKLIRFSESWVDSITKNVSLDFFCDVIFRG